MRSKWLLLWLVAALCACSQEDPEAANTGDAGGSCRAPSGVEDADTIAASDSYYPMVSGATWVYRHSGGSEPWNETVSLNKESDGTFLLSDTPGPSGTSSVSVLTIDGAKVLRTSKQEFTGARKDLSATYDPGFIRFDGAWPLMEENCATTLSYARKEYDAAGQLTRDGDRTHTFTVEQVGVSVSVPAGDFEDCVVIYRSRVRSTGSAASDEDNKRFWFCPGVGKVLEDDEGTGKKEELMSCDIPGGACP